MISIKLVSSIPFRADCIDFVDKDDGRCMFLGDAEEFADEFRSVAQILLNQLGTNHAEEGGRSLIGNGLNEAICKSQIMSRNISQGRCHGGRRKKKA